MTARAASRAEAPYSREFARPRQAVRSAIRSDANVDVAVRELARRTAADVDREDMHTIIAGDFSNNVALSTLLDSPNATPIVT
jgi:hypothetical protein